MAKQGKRPNGEQSFKPKFVLPGAQPVAEDIAGKQAEKSAKAARDEQLRMDNDVGLWAGKTFSGTDVTGDQIMEEVIARTLRKYPISREEATALYTDAAKHVQRGLRGSEDLKYIGSRVMESVEGLAESRGIGKSTSGIPKANPKPSPIMAEGVEVVADRPAPNPYKQYGQFADKGVEVIAEKPQPNPNKTYGALLAKAESIGGVKDRVGKQLFYVVPDTASAISNRAEFVKTAIAANGTNETPIEIQRGDTTFVIPAFTVDERNVPDGNYENYFARLLSKAEAIKGNDRKGATRFYIVPE